MRLSGGYALKGEKAKFLQMGFDGYLLKPVEIAVLAEEMKRVVE